VLLAKLAQFFQAINRLPDFLAALAPWFGIKRIDDFKPLSNFLLANRAVFADFMAD
jgi:hypothetical protein